MNLCWDTVVQRCTCLLQHLLWRRSWFHWRCSFLNGNKKCRHESLFKRWVNDVRREIVFKDLLNAFLNTISNTFSSRSAWYKYRVELWVYFYSDLKRNVMILKCWKTDSCSYLISTFQINFQGDRITGTLNFEWKLLQFSCLNREWTNSSYYLLIIFSFLII